MRAPAIALLIAATLGVSAAAEADPDPDTMPAPNPLPPAPKVVPRRQRHGRFAIGALVASPRSDVTSNGQLVLALDRSTGIQVSFGYPSDSTLSFQLGLRYFFLEQDEDKTSASRIGYSDLGAGLRYTLPIGDTTDFFSETTAIASSLHFTSTTTDVIDSGSKTGFGLLVRAGVVALATGRTSMTLAGSYSVARIKERFNDNYFYPAFASIELAVEWKL